MNDNKGGYDGMPRIQSYGELNSDHKVNILEKINFLDIDFDNL